MLINYNVSSNDYCSLKDKNATADVIFSAVI